MATAIKPLTQAGSTVANNPLASAGDFLLGNVVWIVALVGIVFGIILMIWIMKKKKKYDPFLTDWEIKKNQCKIHLSSGIKDVYIENTRDGLTWMGKYEGECHDKEGYHNIMFSRLKYGKIGGFFHKVLFFARPMLNLILRKYWIVRSNTNDEIEFTIPPEKKGGKPTKKTLKLSIPLIVKGRDSLIIHAEGLQLKKYYTYPILKDKKGIAINDEIYNFKRERDAVIVDTLYEQTVDFSNAMREAINMNPAVRYKMKTGDQVVGDTSGGQG